MQETVKLKKDLNAVQIPFGTPTFLNKGTEVVITYSLGGSYTIETDSNLYRVDNKNADALGKTPEPLFTPAENENATLEDRIWALLRSCYDPEIPVNIVDLGLIYGVEIKKTTEKQGSDYEKRVRPQSKQEDRFDVKIKMTLTAPGCGMGPIIADDAKTRVATLPEVNSVEVEMVFDPPWDRSMMSDQAKLELGML